MNFINNWRLDMDDLYWSPSDEGGDPWWARMEEVFNRAGIGQDVTSQVFSETEEYMNVLLKDQVLDAIHREVADYNLTAPQS